MRVRLPHGEPLNQLLSTLAVLLVAHVGSLVIRCLKIHVLFVVFSREEYVDFLPLRKLFCHGMIVSGRHDIGNAHRNVGATVLIYFDRAHEYLNVAVRLLFLIHETPKSEHGIIIPHDPQ